MAKPTGDRTVAQNLLRKAYRRVRENKQKCMKNYTDISGRDTNKARKERRACHG